jgi:starch-binding outer membrane protein, SusD/RagB family
MKKIIVLLILIATIGNSCKKGLDAKIYGTLNPTNFPKSEADFNLVVTDVYKLFGSKWGYYSDAGGVSGNLFFGVEYSNPFLNDYPTDLIAYFPEWGGFFDGFSKADFNFMKTLSTDRNHLEKIRFISKYTLIIDQIANSSISDASKKQYTAEVKIARGIIMYYLLTMYGPVPYIADATKLGTSAETNLHRPDRASYVAQVESDLRFAADNLVKAPATYGRFNKGCALTYLARLYLNEKSWQKAESALREIVTLGYGLVSDYSSLFKVASEKNNETIWAVTCDAGANGNEPLGNMNAWTFYTYPSDYPGNISSPGSPRQGGWASPNGAFTATWQFYDSFDPLDKRRLLLVPQYNVVNSAGNPTGAVRTRANGMRGPVIAKYPDDDAAAFAGNDIPICRYADVLLMLAEAINEQAGPTIEAQGYINTVRTRSSIPNLSGADIASKDAFRDAILRERGWELYFEGQRRIDLIRMNKWTSTLASVGKTPSPGSALFPVPQYMLDKGMEQTPGY